MTDDKEPSYSISIGDNYATVKAPSKEECLELFHEVAKIKKLRPIDEAIR